MSEIEHHLNDQLLMGYASGILPEAFNLVVATHLAMCDECRARLESLDAIGGTLLEDCAAVDLEDDSFDRVMALIANAPVAEPVSMTPKFADTPSPLVDYIGGGLDDVKWRSIGGGVKQAMLETSKEATARLLFIPGGTAIPDHGHHGTELTLVIKGAFSDEDGRFGPGDLEIAGEHVEHTPIAEPGMDCICLAATDAPLKFNALLPRILQPFIKI